jgi:magnesium-transporting ATPase (P-type)
MADQKIFWLHIMVVVSHCVVFTVSQLMIFRAFDDPSDFNLKLQVYGRITMFTSMCVLQSVMLFMFWKFSRPAFRRIKVASFK